MPLAGLIQADGAIFKDGVSKGGGKRGRATNKNSVIVMAAVKEEAITFVRIDVFEGVENDVISLFESKQEQGLQGHCRCVTTLG